MVQAADTGDWRHRSLLELGNGNNGGASIRLTQPDQVFPVVYGDSRVETRSGSYSSVSKRSTGQKSLPAHSGSAGRSSGSGHGSSGQRQFKKEMAAQSRQEEDQGEQGSLHHGGQLQQQQTSS